MSRHLNLLKQELGKEQPDLVAVMVSLREAAAERAFALKSDEALFEQISEYVRRRETSVYRQLLRPRYYASLVTEGPEQPKLQALLAVFSRINPKCPESLKNMIRAAGRVPYGCDKTLWLGVLGSPDESVLDDTIERECVRRALPAMKQLGTVTRRDIKRLQDPAGEGVLVRVMARRLCERAAADRVHVAEVTRLLFGARGSATATVNMFAFFLRVTRGMVVSMLAAKLPDRLYGTLHEVANVEAVPNRPGLTFVS